MTSALTLEALPDVVRRHVTDVKAIDMHTHLLPPSHGTGKDSLLLFGIDELLTYRMPHGLEPQAQARHSRVRALPWTDYLVAELFMVLPLESPLDSVSQT